MLKYISFDFDGLNNSRYSVAYVSQISLSASSVGASKTTSSARVGSFFC